MRPSEWEEFARVSQEEYAAELASLVGYDEPTARVKAREDQVRMADGLSSPGQFFFMITGEDGRTLGTIWFAEQEEGGNRYAYLYDIRVHEGDRGVGVGRAAMAALVEEVRNRDLAWIELNVFGPNAVARHLYRDVGFEETFVRMRKLVGDD